MASELIGEYIARLLAAPGGYRPLVRTPGGRVAGNFYKAQLASVFQPIVGRDEAVVGHEAFVRSYTEDATALSPWQVFAGAASDEELVRLDRLCRTVHAINYFASASAAARLFLGVEARLLSAVESDHGRVFGRVLTSFGESAKRVVIQLPATVNRNTVLVGHVIANYRHCGYGVAMTLRPGDAAAFEHVALFRPDFVRLRATDHAGSELHDVVQRVHAAGALALVSHIETADQLMGARDAGADLVQGYYLGHPAPQPQPHRRDDPKPAGYPWSDDTALPHVHAVPK